MSAHKLKVWPEFFAAVDVGSKPFELRKDDRGFEVGDILCLMEWSDANGYTGRVAWRKVTYIVRGQFGLLPDYVCMGLGDV